MLRNVTGDCLINMVTSDTEACGHGTALLCTSLSLTSPRAWWAFLLLETFWGRKAKATVHLQTLLKCTDWLLTDQQTFFLEDCPCY